MTRGAKKVWIFLVVLFIAVVIVSAMSGRLPKNSVLMVELGGPVEERE